MDDSNLIWIDMEMTGLVPEKDRILEIATIVTDSNLNILAEGPVLAVHQDKAILDSMDEWCTTHHKGSGLYDRVLASNITEAEAEQRTLDVVSQHVPKGKSPICGNSVSQDRRFLYRYMPKLQNYFHYRTLDVSTVKVLVQRWAPQISFTKKEAHLALDDIRESIAELKFYRERVFKI